MPPIVPAPFRAFLGFLHRRKGKFFMNFGIAIVGSQKGLQKRENENRRTFPNSITVSFVKKKINIHYFKKHFLISITGQFSSFPFLHFETTVSASTTGKGGGGLIFTTSPFSNGVF